ncbi:AHH domain-containing protein [Aliikangiella sp. IMCC44359]|uniref:AHH domain-containing protein n=1 Tax=Aliikangiella sp. IMCC44359 TaxID=3459125 RepID=UPI00403ACE41
MYPHIKLEHTHIEKLLVEFSKIDKPTAADFAAFTTRGLICDNLDKYRLKAAKMSRDELKKEKHNSSRLARHMIKAGDPRPSTYCDCHALISGSRKEAMGLRLVLASLQLRIDDPHNGCWLPRDWQYRIYMPNYLRKAVPHCRIHHKKYYQWLGQFIDRNITRTTEQLINTLRLARTALQSGAVPPEVMPKTGL